MIGAHMYKRRKSSPIISDEILVPQVVSNVVTTKAMTKVGKPNPGGDDEVYTYYNDSYVFFLRRGVTSHFYCTV